MSRMHGSCGSVILYNACASYRGERQMSYKVTPCKSLEVDRERSREVVQGGAEDHEPGAWSVKREKTQFWEPPEKRVKDALRNRGIFPWFGVATCMWYSRMGHIQFHKGVIQIKHFIKHFTYRRPL